MPMWPSSSGGRAPPREDLGVYPLFYENKKGTSDYLEPLRARLGSNAKSTRTEEATMAKKPAAKKPAAKKPAAKKTAAKKTTAKKTVAKKAPAKKTTAKKPAARSSTAKSKSGKK